MRRRSCRQCAGVFAVIAIVIVTLVARRQAGVVALVVVVVVNIHCHCVIGHGILAGTYLAEYRDSLK